MSSTMTTNLLYARVAQPSRHSVNYFGKLWTPRSLGEMSHRAPPDPVRTPLSREGSSREVKAQGRGFYPAFARAAVARRYQCVECRDRGLRRAIARSSEFISRPTISRKIRSIGFRFWPDLMVIGLTASIGFLRSPSLRWPSRPLCIVPPSVLSRKVTPGHES